MTTTPAANKRILYVITDLHLGGVPLHLLRLARAAQTAGHVVRVVSLALPGRVSGLLLDEGIDTRSCGARSISSLAALVRLRHEIRAFRPDLIHSFLFHANIVGTLAARVAPSVGVNQKVSNLGLRRARRTNQHTIVKGRGDRRVVHEQAIERFIAVLEVA